jgi:hypothetical protein
MKKKIKTSKDRIYIKEWMAFKPYNKQSPTDLYYLKLCNRVNELLINDHNAILGFYLEKEGIQTLSCFLVSYFEDVISGAGLWNSFVRKHEEMYGKKLPFYATEEYDEEEINEQDLAFLTWYFLNTYEVDDVLDPHEPLIHLLAGDVMEIFEEVYEIAPENEQLRAVYELSPDSDYYTVRNLVDKILFESYLFYPDTGLQLREAEEELIAKHGTHINLLSLLNDNRDRMTHASYTRLLSLRGKDWAAEILGNTHPLYTALSEMSDRVQGMFLYKGQDQTHIQLEHVASSKSFQLIKESFDHAEQLKDIDTMIFLGVVKWKGDWWFSGIFFTQPYDPATVMELKKAKEHKQEVAFLDQDEAKINEILEEQKQRFLEFNHGLPIAFMPTGKLNKFFKDFISYYNQSLNLSEQEQEKSRKKAAEEGLPELGDIFENDYSEYAEDGLVFFNPKSGGEVAIGMNSAFPAEENPFYREEESEDTFINLLISRDFSKEMVHYCIDYYKDDLPIFKEETGKVMLEELDFLLRFFKVESYHTKPAVSLV